MTIRNSRWLTYFLFAALALGFAELTTNTFWTLRPAPPPPFNQWTRACPIDIEGALGVWAARVQRDNQWQVYTYGASAPAPDVGVEPAFVDMSGKPAIVCRLSLLRVPGKPEPGADWRLGHILADASGILGDKVELRLRIRGDRTFALTRASAYIYDGVGGVGAQISRITPEWQLVTVKMTVSPAAPRLEFWLRLLLDDGIVEPNTGTIYFAASASLVK